MPDKVLDAPGFLDDYYLNLIDWSSENRVAIALGDIAYVWNAQDGSVTGMGEGTYVSLLFSHLSPISTARILT